MAFTPKDWRNATTYAGGGDTSTPLTATALEDVETRVTDYAALLAGTPGGIHNVLDYGATGTGDDSTEIQAAITACIAAGGGIVYLPPLSFAISTGLTISGAGVTIYAKGATLTRTANITGLLVTADAVIHDLTMDGNSQAGTGIEVSGAGNILECHNCTSSNNGAATGTSDGFSAFSGGILRTHNCTADNNTRAGFLYWLDAGDGGSLNGRASGNEQYGAWVMSDAGTSEYFYAEDNGGFGLAVGVDGDGPGLPTPTAWSFDYIETNLTGDTVVNASGTGVEMWGAKRCTFDTIVAVANPGYGVALSDTNGTTDVCEYNRFGAIYADGEGAFDTDPAVHLSGGATRNTFGLIVAKNETFAVSATEGVGDTVTDNFFDTIYAHNLTHAVIRCDDAADNLFRHVTAVDCISTDAGTWPGLMSFSAATTTGNVIESWEDRTVDASPPNAVFSQTGSAAGNYYKSPAILQTVESSTVASTSTMTLPHGHDFITVSGTADITSITASYVGRRVTLVFSGTKATNGLVDGSNLKLASTLAYTPDDTITLVCDGTNWYETGRSVN